MLFFFFFNDTATTEIYTLSLHDALPISHHRVRALVYRVNEVLVDRESDRQLVGVQDKDFVDPIDRSEEHTSELQSLRHLVCRLLLEKKKHTYRSSAQSSLTP